MEVENLATAAELQDPASLAATLETDIESGLSDTEASHRLDRDGANELPTPSRELVVVRFLRQFVEPMAVLLVVAAAVSGIGLREWVDALAITAIVLLNAIIGTVQEGRAARALEALREMETPMSIVRRSARTRLVPSRDLVSGDVVVLQAGDRVPADVRLTLTRALEIDESILTGESLPVVKDAGEEPRADTALASQRWMAFTGTLVTRGAAEGLVVRTATATYFGRLAAQLSGTEPATPLQVELARLTARLGAIAVAVAAAVFGLSLLRIGSTGEDLQEAFLVAVALAVAAVPEGLATVVAVALALGVRRMAAHGAIIRRMPAVEALGSATAILTDKTGTLTENRLRLSTVVTSDRAQQKLADLPPPVSNAVVEIAAACNDATLQPPTGDPLDLALLEAVGATPVARVRAALPRVDEIPFDSERKRMTTLHRRAGSGLLLVKGAPEAVLGRCDHTMHPDGSVGLLSDARRQALLTGSGELADHGMRTLALAFRELPSTVAHAEADEQGLTVVGLVGLRDHVRPEALPTISDARRAGVNVVMVTGDHPGTAAWISREVGLLEDTGHVLTGDDLRRRGVPRDPLASPVYARVDPDQKLALVRSTRAQGDVVAVTGDGVNDAPALREADIGVAMGRGGTQVAREAADMVVTDDNLATLVMAVREGRGIYDNIRKVVDYLIAGNLSEILVVIVPLVLFPALGVPLLPVQLLWINLLTDGLPALALGVDPVDPDVMNRTPRSRHANLLGLRRLALLLRRGALIAAAAITSLVISRYAFDEPWAHARATMFTVLVVAHLVYAIAVHTLPVEPSETPPRAAPNWRLLAAVGGGVALQVLIILWPAARSVFDTAELTGREWLLVVGGGLLPPALIMLIERRPRLGGDRNR
jgi:P-type Ca2+ transporter type 2C